MIPPLYRITGISLRWNYDLNRYEPTGDRVPVRRARSGDVAYYENREDAIRGLRGFKGNGRSYTDYRIEWSSVSWSDA